MGSNKLLVLFLVMMGGFNLVAQESRIVVYFTDKDHSNYSLNAPGEYLSPRAIQRREKQGIAITKNDLPVNEQYVEGLRNAGAEVYFRSRWFNAVLVEADQATIEAITQLPFVLKTDLAAPGSKLGEEQGNAGSSFQGAVLQQLSLSSDDQNNMLGVPEMHEQGYTGEGILIGVFDGGFENVNTVPFFEHLFTDNKIVATYDFVKNDTSVYEYASHGTKVLSTIAAYAPGSLIGTGYGADFILCVTEDVEGEYRIEEYNWLFAAEYADSAGVDIINTSLGYTTFNDSDMNYTHEDLDGWTAVISRASAIAASKGILVVSSAGNEGNGSWQRISAPADADSTLSVGAVGLDFKKTTFSSPGPTADGRIKPEVSALGLGTTVGSPNGNFEQSNGTSFAAPLITGFAAGVWQAYPDLTNIELIEKIKMSGNHAKLPNNLTGYGVPNFSRVQLGIVLAVDKSVNNIFRVYPNPVKSDQVFIETENTTPGKVIEVKIYDSRGKLITHNDTINKLTGNRFKVDVTDFNPGIYIINITSSDTSESLKLLKF